MRTTMDGVQGMDAFDVLLGDVLQGMANPEMPDRLRAKIEARFWRQDAAARTAVVFSPAAFMDRMAVQRDAKSTWTAVLLHVAAIGLIGWLGVRKVHDLIAPPPALLTQLTVPPPRALPKATLMGGGGGQRGPTPVTKGHMPQFAENQIVPPKAPPMQEPKIRIDPTIEVQKDVKMANSALPNLGMPNSPLVGTSMGNGKGTGIGSGSGAGIGPGYGGNVGGGPKHIGGGVSAPTLIFQVDPEFSEEARKARTQGNVLVNLWVDEHGNPSHVKVLRGVWGWGWTRRRLRR